MMIGPTLGRHRQEDCFEFVVNLVYTVSSRPAMGLYKELLSNNIKNILQYRVYQTIHFWTSWQMEELVVILRGINSMCFSYNSENVLTIIIMTLLIIIFLNHSVIKVQIKNNNNQTNAHPKAVFIIAHKKESSRGHVEECD